MLGNGFLCIYVDQDYMGPSAEDDLNCSWDSIQRGAWI